MQILGVFYHTAGWLVYRRNVAGFATANVCQTQHHQPSGKNMSTLKILRIPSDPRWACKVHFLLPILSLLSRITVWEVKIVHKKRKMLSPWCCICSWLPTCWDVVCFCDKFVLNIQWRISRWNRDQSPNLLNICSISQLSEPNQTREKNHPGNKLSNDQTKPTINRNNEAKSTFLNKSHRWSLKSQSSHVCTSYR